MSYLIRLFLRNCKAAKTKDNDNIDFSARSVYILTLNAFGYHVLANGSLLAMRVVCKESLATTSGI